MTESAIEVAARAATEAARRVLDDGRGLDEVVALLRGAGLPTILLIKALRDATGLGLSDAVSIVDGGKDGSLAHVTRERLSLLGRARRASGGWWTSLYCDAQFSDAPWLTMIPGRAGALGAVYFWRLPAVPPDADLWIAEASGHATPELREFRRRLEREPELLERHPGSISGPGVSYDSFRAELRELAADNPFWREHVELVHDGERSQTCRFKLTP